MLKAFLLIIAHYSTIIRASSITKCSDLVDNPGRFWLVSQNSARSRSCGWVDRQWKCNYDEVKENCPIKCRIPCQSTSNAFSSNYPSYRMSESPSALPTNSPSLKPTSPPPTLSPTVLPSISPTILPSTLPTDTALPFCDDLQDNEKKFPVSRGVGIEMRSCKWASKFNPNHRCNSIDVRTNCPVLCRVECEHRTYSPSVSTRPSNAPSISILPSQQPSTPPSNIPSETPSASPSKVYCENLEDETEAFHVIEMEGNDLKSCSWASENNTTQRCEIDTVLLNCPVLCKLPCHQKTVSPSTTPVEEEAPGISKANVDPPVPSEPSTKNMVIIGILCGGLTVVLAIMASSVGYSKQRKRKDFSLSIDSDVLYIGSESTVKNVKAPVPIKMSSSYIPSNRYNLGLVHSGHDVQNCKNFPCEYCQSGNRVVFIPTKKDRAWITSRQNKDEIEDISPTNSNDDDLVYDISLDDSDVSFDESASTLTEDTLRH